MKKLTFALTLALSVAIPAWADDTDDDCGFKLPVGYVFDGDFDPCDSDSELAPITPTPHVGYADKTGKIVITPKFTEAYEFSEGLGLVKHKDKYGYVNAKGEFVIKPTFDDAWSFSEGRAKIEQAGKFGFIDQTGKIVIKPIYDEVGDWFEGGLVSASKNDKYGFIDQAGKTKVAFEYDAVEEFSEGLALVSKKVGTDEDGDEIYHYGFIGTDGKIAIELVYSYATSFDNGTATVIKDGNAYTINKQGKVVKTEVE